MLPYSMIAGGNFTLVNKTLPYDLTVISQSPPDYFVLRNRTAWGVANAPTEDIEFVWHNGMAQGTSQDIRQTTATLALTSHILAADGISTYDTANPPTFAALAATAINQAAGATVLMANTGTISVGDTVRLYGVTGMQQIAGEDFTVTAVNPNVSITLGYLNSAGFAAPATAAQVLKFIPNRDYPRWRWIMSITQAAQAVITFTHTHDFTVGERVSFRIPPQFGMVELNNVAGTVQAITASTITINVDTSGFTAFAYPTSAVAAHGVHSAVCVPSASGIIPGVVPTMNLIDAFDNRNVRLIHLGATIFADATNGDVFDWAAYKFDKFN